MTDDERVKLAREKYAQAKELQNEAAKLEAEASHKRDISIALYSAANAIVQGLFE